jgi:hypothetical protein
MHVSLTKELREYMETDVGGGSVLLRSQGGASQGPKDGLNSAPLIIIGDLMLFSIAE